MRLPVPARFAFRRHRAFAVVLRIASR